MGETEISWTHRPGTVGRTWNPGQGCSRVSEGCRNCYAERLAARFAESGWSKGLINLKTRKWNGTVFANSMTDLFHEGYSNEEIAAVFGVMAACPQHTFQVLTKRARRMREWFEVPGIADLVEKFKQIALAGRIEEYFAEERTLPIVGWDGYFITSRGRVLSTSGSDTCQWCSVAIDGDLRKKFCSQECRSKAHYEQQRGRWTPPDTIAKEMHSMPAESGHQRVMLYRDSGHERFLVHRLVLEAFDRAGRDGEQACHIDGDPSNNALRNLRWGTQSNNWDDSKRHGTQRRYSKITEEQANEIRQLGGQGVGGAELGRRFGISDTQARNIVSGKQWAPEYRLEWPLKSVWLGVSVENQAAADERIPELLATPAAVRFLSCEPLLGPVDLTKVGRYGTEPLSSLEHVIAIGVDRPPVSWVIAGCESGAGARECKIEWLRSLRDQCAAAGTPFFLKQAVEDRGSDFESGDMHRIAMRHGSKRKPGGVIELPALDGEQHAAFPEARR